MISNHSIKSPPPLPTQKKNPNLERNSSTETRGKGSKYCDQNAAALNDALVLDLLLRETKTTLASYFPLSTSSQLRQRQSILSLSLSPFYCLEFGPMYWVFFIFRFFMNYPCADQMISFFYNILVIYPYLHGFFQKQKYFLKSHILHRKVFFISILCRPLLFCG